MENMNKIIYKVLILAQMIILPFFGIGQIKIKIEPHQLSVADTLRIGVENVSRRKGYYNIAWQVFERNRWRMMRTDILNDFPMAMVFQNITNNNNCNKYFVIDDIFKGTFRMYRELPGRLVLTYSYSSELEPRKIIYSEKFIVKAKQYRIGADMQ